MCSRPALLALFAALLIAAGTGTGCQRAEPPPRPLPSTALSPDTLASVHWVGKCRLDLEADAYFFSRVWSLPETKRLQAQTLDRFAIGFWRRFLGDAAAVGIPPVVLRPLLEDLVDSESYLEIRAATNSQLSTVDAQPALVFAIQVSDRRAGFWETNLAVAAQLLTGLPAVSAPVARGWQLQRTAPPNVIRFTRFNGWLVLSVGPRLNPLLDDIISRVHRQGVPFVSAGTNLWLEATLAPSRLADVFSLSARPTGAVGIPSSILHPLSSISAFFFSFSGDGGNVITRARVELAQPLPADLTPWQLPLPLLHEPLNSFTAMRGLQPWLAGLPWWRESPAGSPPDQLFFWSLGGSPYQTYLAAPVPEAGRQGSALAGWLMQKANPWLAANGYISFDPAPDGNGVTWGNLPDIRPFIKSAGADDQGWLFAGLFPDTNLVTTPPPAGMFKYILQRTNLVYYGWEVTGPCLQPCFELGQTVRLIMRQPQLPANCASLNWLTMLVPRLGTSATLINRTGPAELTLYRRSTLGLTAPELQLLAGWLESP